MAKVLHRPVDSYEHSAESNGDSKNRRRRNGLKGAGALAIAGILAFVGVKATSGGDSTEPTGRTTDTTAVDAKPKYSPAIERLDKLEPNLETSTDREAVIQNLLNNYYGYVNSGDPQFKNYLLSQLTGFQSLEDLRQSTVKQQALFPDYRHSGKLVKILDDNASTPLQEDIEVITFRFDQFEHLTSRNTKQFENTFTFTIRKSERDITDNGIDDFVTGYLLSDAVEVDSKYVGL